MRKILLVLSLVLTLSPAMLAQRKVITNFDLEKYKQQRLQSEAEYDRTAEQRGFPSREELAERERERQQYLAEFSQQYRAQQSESANYWETQSYALRTEIAAVEAEINYVRARVGDIPSPQTYYGVGYLPYGYGGYRGNYGYGGVSYPRFPRGNGGVNKTGVVTGVQTGNPATTGTFGGRGLIGAGGRGLIGSNLGNQTTVAAAGSYRNGNFGVSAGYRSTTGTGVNFGGIPYQPGILTVPFTLPTLENLTREELLARLSSLEQTRAGLYARFSVLQDEARRNGVKIEF